LVAAVKWVDQMEVPVEEVLVEEEAVEVEAAVVRVLVDHLGTLTATFQLGQKVS
jgi:hypothetical protein